MKRYLKGLTLVLILIMTISGCSSGRYFAASSPSVKPVAKISKKSKALPAIEIKGERSFPLEGGIKIESARTLIIGYLSKIGMKGDIGSNIKLWDITAAELWDNSRTQLFRATLDYASLYGVFVIRDGKIQCLLEGMPIKSIFIDDLDGDGKYELYTNILLGSGIVSQEIRGYNIATDTSYSYGKRMERELILFIRNDELWVKEYKFDPSYTETEAGAEPVDISKLIITAGNKLDLISDTYLGKNSAGRKIQLFLPKLKDTYSSVYEHYGELKLDEVDLMDKPLLDSGEILGIEEGVIKTKKKIIVVKGNGMESNLIYDEKKGKSIEFDYGGKHYSVKRDSSKFFYYYPIFDICIVIDKNNIFMVTQKEYTLTEEGKKSGPLNRKYSKSPIGVPYVLIVNGKRTELGILKAGEGEFAVPEVWDSWCYMGFPVFFPELSPVGDVLKRNL